MQLPKISVITVTFNAEQYIEGTIKNVIGQTYRNIEYVIIDGESKDRTLEIVENYKSNIDILISESDKGLYDAMNKGIRVATGEYLIFMNAGDIFANENSLNEAINAAGNVDFIYSNPLRVLEGNAGKRGWHKQTPKQHELKPTSFLQGMVICHQCMVVRKSCVNEYDLTWKISGDIDWSIRFVKKIKTWYYHDEIFCHYLDGGVSETRRKQGVKERFKICVKHFGLFRTIWAQFGIIGGIIRRKGKLS